MTRALLILSTAALLAAGCSSQPAPAAAPPPSQGAADDAVTPERQPFLDALTAIDPVLTSKPSRALSRAENSCYDIKKGVAEADLISRTAQRYNGGNAVVKEAKGALIVEAIKSTNVCATFDLPD